MQEKVTTLDEAIAPINDGDVVALQNMATQAAPMALVRELIRQQKRDLGLVVLVGGMAVDWLAGAGVINRLIGAAVTMEQFGLCQQYRQGVEAGRIRVEELCETVLNARLGAGARNLPPDVALVHAHRADRFGNIQYEPTTLWPDIGIMPMAARRVIVTAEEIVDTEVLRRNPDRTILPGFMVDAVVEVPYGAHPTSFFPNYGYDSRFHREWVEAARDPEQVNAFIDRYVRAPSDQKEYLHAVGGVTVLERIGRWEEGK